MAGHHPEQRNAIRLRLAHEHLQRYLRRESQPMPGDAVRLTTPWYEADAGAIGILGGVAGEFDDEPELTFRVSSAFRGPAHEHLPLDAQEIVECSGGPGLFLPDVAALTWTGLSHTQRFWRWVDFPRGGGGVAYTLDVPLWDWTPPTRSP